MSINSAFNNATSGLNVTSRRVELISNNISNALTDGFSRREISLSSVELNNRGGGVRVEGVNRAENASLSASRREADAARSSTNVTSNVLSRIDSRLGGAGELGALATKFSNLERSFIDAANDPSNDMRLNEVISSSKEIVSSLNEHSEYINALRIETDAEIGKQVSVVNQSIEMISDLNTEIKLRTLTGGSTASLKDRQDVLLDQLNSIIPIKTISREGGEIAIFTPSGGKLLDGSPSLFEFTNVSTIVHGMTIANGALSGLSVNGSVVSMNTSYGLYEGGSLAALFDVRDQVLPQHNDELDALAGNLALRFQDPMIDPSLAVGDPGLFTASLDMSSASFAAYFTSELSTRNINQQDLLTYEQSRSDEFRITELAVTGVDTDAELQSLIELETAFSANAKVISVLDELLSRILEI